MSQTDVLGAVTPVVVTTGVVTVLPNTGSNVWVTIAVAVAAGLATWAVLYKKRAAQK